MLIDSLLTVKMEIANQYKRYKNSQTELINFANKVLQLRTDIRDKKWIFDDTQTTLSKACWDDPKIEIEVNSVEEKFVIPPQIIIEKGQILIIVYYDWNFFEKYIDHSKEVNEVLGFPVPELEERCKDYYNCLALKTKYNEELCTELKEKLTPYILWYFL